MKYGKSSFDDRYDWDGATLTLKDDKSCSYIKINASDNDVNIVFEGKFTINYNGSEFHGIQIGNAKNSTISGGDVTINVLREGYGIEYWNNSENAESYTETIKDTKMTINMAATGSDRTMVELDMNGDLVVENSKLYGYNIDYGLFNDDSGKVTIKNSDLMFECAESAKAIFFDQGIFSDVEPSGNLTFELVGGGTTTVWDGHGTIKTVTCNGKFTMGTATPIEDDSTNIMLIVGIVIVALVEAGELAHYFFVKKKQNV